MKTGLHLSARQSLRMTPRLQQVIRLLQLSAPELEEEIKSALEANPMLESIEEEQPSTELFTEQEQYYLTDTAAPQNSLENLSNIAPSLQDHLYWQLNLTPFADRDRVIAIMIIDSINDEGYLSTSVDDLRNSLIDNYPNECANLEDAEIIAVLNKIQQFDPVGVGARSLQECLAAQLTALDTTTPGLQLASTLVQQHLELLGSKNYTQIKQLCKITDSELDQALQLIASLHPHPGELIASHDIEYIIPDLIVSKQNGKWVVDLSNDWCTKIRINPSYAALIKRGDNSRDNQFMRDQLAEAKFLLSGIQNRNQSLLKVARSIIAAQQQFLEHGAQHMQPMILQDIALAVGLNESTISRITSKKYVHTPRGVLELKYFFSGYIANDHGENCSSTAIKAIIKQLVSKETPEHRLSDQDLVDIMLQRGIKIARRTVAKYRESMGINSANKRRI